MPSSFPGSNDSFSTPSTPDTTPLSSAGTSNRNHTQSHQDLGDAVSSIEQNVPLLSHDHSGSGSRATQKLSQSSTHQSPDTDSSTASLHHTLGVGANQAAQGTHNHDTLYPKKTVANTFTVLQTFSTGISVPQNQWTNANHTHESVTQGGMALPWKFIQSLTTNYVLDPSQSGYWNFHVPALPIKHDMEIHCHIYLESSTADFQLITFFLQDYTSTAAPINILLGKAQTRNPQAVLDTYQWTTELYGMNTNYTPLVPRIFRVTVLNGQHHVPTTTVGTIVFFATPFNSL